MEERFPEDVPCPQHWGGWRIVPLSVNAVTIPPDVDSRQLTKKKSRSLQRGGIRAGQPSRLHDRFRYTREQASHGPWKIERLAP